MKNYMIMQVVIILVLFAAMATRFTPVTSEFGEYAYTLHSVLSWWLFWSALSWTLATDYHRGDIKDKIHSMWLVNVVYWVVFHWLLFNGDEPHWWDHLALGVTISIHGVLTWFLRRAADGMGE